MRTVGKLINREKKNKDKKKKTILPKYLKGKKSFVKFCNHDSLVIDLAEEDQHDINKISKLFSNTRFGKFKINHEGGKNWSEMKPLNIK
jgi:hypothetical protein